jgi:hypothetical protein
MAPVSFLLVRFVQSEGGKPEDVVHVYDALLQNVADTLKLPGLDQLDDLVDDLQVTRADKGTTASDRGGSYHPWIIAVCVWIWIWICTARCCRMWPTRSSSRGSTSSTTSSTTSR